MLLNYLQSAWRQLRKNRLFSFVNILGLSTGLAGIMVLAILVFQYFTTDHILKDRDQLFFVRTTAPDGSAYSMTTYPLLGEVIRTCPEVEAASRIQQYNSPWLKYSAKVLSDQTQYVDTGFFRVFQFPLKYGDPASALRDKYSIVLSEEMAEKFFGDKNPLGLVLTGDDTLQLTVTGVLRHVPGNTTIQPKVLLSTSLLESNTNFMQAANWYNTFSNCYLRLRPNARLADLDARMQQIVAKDYAPETRKVRLNALPFSRYAELDDPMTGTIIRAAIAAGIFVLLIMLVNLINLNTASLYSRAKEVAVRQMIGSGKRRILAQFCTENGVILLLSLAVAWILFSLLLLPGVNDMLRERAEIITTSFVTDLPLIFFFAGLGILFAVLAGSLPVIRLLALKVTDTVKGQLGTGKYKASGLRNVFITIQFVFAIILIGATIILNRQIHYMKSVQPGFNKDEVVIGNIGLAYTNPEAADIRFGSILSEAGRNPHIKAISTNLVVPTAYWINYNDCIDPTNGKSVHFRIEPADAGYLPTYQIPLIEGRNFNDTLDKSAALILINQTAMRALGWTHATGRQLRPKGGDEVYTVIGVTEDFHYQGLKDNVEPLIHWYRGKPTIGNNYLSIRTDPGYQQAAINYFQQAFKSISSRRSLEFSYMNDKVDQQYAMLDNILKITNAIALLAIVIAGMGIFALVALFARLRVKEIGIRKVLGADTGSLVILLARDFALMVGVAILVASPLYGVLMHKWLQNFAYRIGLEWWMFLLAGLIALLVTALTVGVQSIRAARANPVNSLRSE